MSSTSPSSNVVLFGTIILAGIAVVLVDGGGSEPRRASTGVAVSSGTGLLDLPVQPATEAPAHSLMTDRLSASLFATGDWWLVANSCSELPSLQFLIGGIFIKRKGETTWSGSWESAGSEVTISTTERNGVRLTAPSIERVAMSVSADGTANMMLNGIAVANLKRC